MLLAIREAGTFKVCSACAVLRRAVLSRAVLLQHVSPSCTDASRIPSEMLVLSATTEADASHGVCLDPAQAVLPSSK